MIKCTEVLIFEISMFCMGRSAQMLDFPTRILTGNPIFGPKMAKNGLFYVYRTYLVNLYVGKRIVGTL